MNAPVAVPDPLVGRVLQQRYRVVERLSEGAMGVVYRGERLALQRPVAIKFLHAAVAEQESLRRRFEVEARAMGRLSHPNCVSVIDFGVEEVPYVVMDLVDGRSLRDILDTGGLSTTRALNVGRQLLTALVHAHAQGIIHRDIKPENMMLQHSAGLEDHLRVLDFGMAKITNHSAGLTAGFVLGTPNYMAPEQAQESDIDARADLYSAGIVIFELLTNRQPFAADTMGEVLRRQLQMPAPALRSVAPAANHSAALEALLLRAMAKRPAERYATAAEMLEALEALPEFKGSGTPAPAASRRLPPPPFRAKVPPAPSAAEDATKLDLPAPKIAEASPVPPAFAPTAMAVPAASHAPAGPEPTMQLDESDAEPVASLTLPGRVARALRHNFQRAAAVAALWWRKSAGGSRRTYALAGAGALLLVIGVWAWGRPRDKESDTGRSSARAPRHTETREAAAAKGGEPAASSEKDGHVQAAAEPKPNTGGRTSEPSSRSASRSASHTSASRARWTQPRSETATRKAPERRTDAPVRRANPSERWGTHWNK